MRKIQKFKVGSAMEVLLTFPGGTQQNVTGICVKKKNKGLSSAFVLELKSVSGGTGVSQRPKAGRAQHVLKEFPLYAPYIKAIRVAGPLCLLHQHQHQHKKKR
jgi:ribosomal protein L19